MEMLSGLFTHTPAWVYVLFGYLVWRGVMARKPGEVSPAKLAVIPVIFTVMGLVELQRLYGFGAANVGLWLLAFLAGAAIGAMLVRRGALVVDRVRGVIQRPADYSVLPLMLVAFGSKYAFGVMLAIAPEQTAQPWFRVLEIATYGFFAGIFAGKFLRYLQAYLAVPKPAIAS